MAKIIDAGQDKVRKVIKLSELNFGDTITVKLLDKIGTSIPFYYPAYKPDFNDKEKFIDGFAAFNMTLEGGEPSLAEKAMLEIFNTALANLTQTVVARAAKRNQTVDFHPEKIESKKPDGFWGKGYDKISLPVIEKGNICDMILTQGQANQLRQARDKVVGGLLEYTPLLCNLKIDITEGREYTDRQTKARKKAKALSVTVVEPQGKCKSLLPASFLRCAWTHPDDFQKVQEWVKAYHESKYNFSEEPPQPPFRDFPDVSGKLYFVATQSVQDPIWVNVYEHGISTGMVNAIANREATWMDKSATQHSLLGGYFYRDKDGSRRPVSMKEIKENFLRSENGIAVVNLDGGERQLEFIKGSLYDKKFNPLLVDDTQKYVFEDSNPDELVTLAKKLGIPVKGDPDPVAITSWDEFLASGSAAPSTSAPVSML